MSSAVNGSVVAPAVASEDRVKSREALLDQHVDYYLRKHPEFYSKHTITKIRPTVYNLDGRIIEVDWQYGEGGRPGFLLAIDGPLRQPFDDYLLGTEANAQFDDKRLARTSLHQIPKGRQLSFRDDNQVYSRLEAMKVAKEQALVREQAAEYVKDGAFVPESALMAKYQKQIDIKLGNRMRRQNAAPKNTNDAPQPSPRLAAQSPAPPPLRQGAPVYCSKHSTNRPKTAPRSIQCTACMTTIQTNYIECALCPGCSQVQNRCVCCGTPVNSYAGQTSLPKPAYCTYHGSSDKRTKTQPRHEECKSCRTVIETNYVDFAVCAQCSNATQRCMCCGNPAVGSTTTPVSRSASSRFQAFDGAASIFNLRPGGLMPNLAGTPNLSTSSPYNPLLAGLSRVRSPAPPAFNGMGASPIFGASSPFSPPRRMM